MVTKNSLSAYCSILALSSCSLCAVLSGCSVSTDDGALEREDDLASAKITQGDLARTVTSLKPMPAAADADRNGSLSPTEARNLMSDFAVRSFFLDQIESGGSVAVSTLGNWLDQSASELVTADKDGNGVSRREAGGTSPSARHLHALVAGRRNFARGVAFSDLGVESITETFDVLAGADGILTTTEVLRSPQGVAIRDFFLDALQTGSTAQRPTLARVTFVDWLGKAQQELTDAGVTRESKGRTSSTEALQCGALARHFWALAAEEK